MKCLSREQFRYLWCSPCLGRPAGWAGGSGTSSACVGSSCCRSRPCWRTSSWLQRRKSETGQSFQPRVSTHWPPWRLLDARRELNGKLVCFTGHERDAGGRRMRETLDFHFLSQVFLVGYCWFYCAFFLKCVTLSFSLVNVFVFDTTEQDTQTHTPLPFLESLCSFSLSWFSAPGDSGMSSSIASSDSHA